MKDIAKEIIDKTIENIDSPADGIDKVIGALVDKVNKQNAILIELEKDLKDTYDYYKNEDDKYADATEKTLNRIQELKEKYK